jgi:hypothetical protein
MITFKDKGFWFLGLKVNMRTTFEQCYRMGIHFLIVQMWLTSYVVVVMSIYCKRIRGSCPQSSKKILDECLNYNGRDSPRWKKRGIRTVARGILRKVAKTYSMHASKPSRVMILGTFYVSRINMEWIKRVWYHMFQLLEAKWTEKIELTLT